jgi:Tol biopolymer transport system component
MDPDGSHVSTILSEGGSSGPTWSPDGSLIAFTRSPRSGNPEQIFLVRPDGTGLVQITNGTESDSGLSWQRRLVEPSPTPSDRHGDFPENGKIAFAKNRDGTESLYLVNPDGTGLEPWVHEPLLGWPSPDWTKVTFSRTRHPLDRFLPDETEIHVADADGRNDLIVAVVGNTHGFARWSPDGSRLAFAGGDQGTLSIYTVSIDGSALKKLTDPGAGTNCADASPAWSPDGGRIAFMHLCQQPGSLTVMNADGTDQRVLAQGWGLQIPVWDPTGTLIAMQGPDGHVLVAHADGSGISELTSVDEGLAHGPARWAAWSPDGSMLAFSTMRDGDPEVYVMNADGSDQRNLTIDPAAEDNLLDWYPAGWTHPSIPPRAGPGGSDCFKSTVVGDFDGDGIDDTATVYPKQDIAPPDCDPGSFSTMRQVIGVTTSGGADASYEFECDAVLCEAQGWLDADGVLRAPDFDGDGVDELAVSVSQGASFATFAIYRVTTDEGVTELQLEAPGDPSVGLAPGPIRLTIATDPSMHSTVNCEPDKGIVLRIDDTTDVYPSLTHHERWLAFDGTTFRIVYSRDDPQSDDVVYVINSLETCV